MAASGNSAAQFEGVKLVCDYLKHLTTLSTGSIVVIATFMQKALGQLQWRALAAVAIGGFILTILGAMIANGVLVARAEQGNFTATTGAEQQIEGWAVLAAFIGFIIALLSLAIFAIRNFF